MKSFAKYIGLVFLFLSAILHSCKKEEVPTVTTVGIKSITISSAISGGDVIFDGGSMVSGRGVCWSTTISPTISNDKTSDGAGEGGFSSSLTNLLPGTEYIVRAYATNSSGTGYGDTISFITLGNKPLAFTLKATNLVGTSGTLNGNISANLLPTSVTFEYGTTSSYGNTIIAIPNTVEGEKYTKVSANITGLTEFTTYHYRVVAINSAGTTYGRDILFTANLGIGKSYAGGLVFYIDTSSVHGLAAAPYDQSTGVQWFNGTYVEVVASGKDIGTGQSNTNKIVAIQGNGNYAAKICDDLTLNGFSDWFLPSVNELTEIDDKLYKVGLGAFVNGKYYWSSTEYSNENAASVPMGDIGWSSEGRIKSSIYFVRAVRAF